jgi:hypothetical protein
LPAWILVAGGVGIIVILVCLVFAMRGKTQNATANTSPPHTPLVTPQNTDTNAHSLVPLPPIPTHQNPETPEKGTPVPPNPAKATPTNYPPAAYTGTEGGHVWRPGELAGSRTSDRYYIIVASTPDSSIAERNAIWIADHGVDVSIETTIQNGKVMYRIISAEGFKSVSDAKSLIDTIVQIGRKTPEYKKTHRAWDDAFAMKIIPKTPKP